MPKRKYGQKRNAKEKSAFYSKTKNTTKCLKEESTSESSDIEEKSVLYSKTENSAKRMKRESTSECSNDEENFLSSPNDTDENQSSRPQSALSDFQFSEEEIETDNNSNSSVCISPQVSENEEATKGNYDGFASFLKSFDFMTDDEETDAKTPDKSSMTPKKSLEKDDISSDESICFKPKPNVKEDWVPVLKDTEKTFKAFTYPHLNYAVVFFEHPCKVPLVGHLKVTLLSGKASIYGYELKYNQPVVIFSKRETGILSVVSHSFPRDSLAFRYIRRGIQEQNVLTFKDFKKTLTSNFSHLTGVVTLQEMQVPPNLQFLKLYAPKAADFITQNKLGCVSYTTKESSGVLDFNDNYEEIFERIENHLSKINKGNSSGWFDGSDLSSSESETEEKKKEQKNSNLSGSRILLHGHKRTGKSTMIRYFVNKFLNKYSEVFHLESDPGQTEFTPPGALSLTRITKPIFGPSFTHQMTPLKSIFIGTITPEASPPMHIRSVLKLIEYFNQNFPHGILLVNTLGWVEGIGDMILQVIKKNLEPVVDIELIHEAFPLTSTSDGGLLKIKFGLTSKCDPGQNFKAVNFRELAILSYLGKCQPYYKQPTFLNEIRPVRVCWDDVAVYNFNKRLPYTRFYEALNCSIVALCSVDESYMLMTTNAEYPNTLDDEPNNNCLGFGFVRAVDEEQHLLYIVTPLNLQTLRKVNAILSGNITVPPSVILKQPVYETGLYFTDAGIRRKKPFIRKFGNYKGRKTLSHCGHQL